MMTSARHGKKARRAGLTLVELLTAMAIAILLAAITVPTVITVLRGDRLRSASASVQGMITASRERAALDGAARGIRLIPDPENPEVCRQVIFIREALPLAPGAGSGGGAIVTDTPPALANLFDIVEIDYNQRFAQTLAEQLPREEVRILRHGLNNVVVSRGVLRVGNAGPYRSFSYVFSNNSINERTVGSQRRTRLILDEPLESARGFETGGSLAQSGLPIEIFLPPVPLEGADPLVLPTGIVIDLGQLPKPPNLLESLGDSTDRLTRLKPRLSVGLAYSPSNPDARDYGFEIMFGPDREVIGAAGHDDRVILFIRDEAGVVAEENSNYLITNDQGMVLGGRKQLRATSSNSCSLVVLKTRTGEVGTFKPVLVDEKTEARNAAGVVTISPGEDGWFDWDQYYSNVLAGIGVND